MAKASKGREKLEKLYPRILQLLRKIPKEAAYRKHTEAIICYRLTALKETESCKTEELRIKGFEERLCNGRIECLIRQAADEYELIQQMIFYKPWEPLIEKPPPEQWKWPPFDCPTTS